MKNALKIVFFIAVLLNVCYAQNGFNYQAVIRNSEEKILVNQKANLLISLIKDSNTGEVVYAENHFVTTNSLGLVSLIIGEGNEVTSNFSQINWNEGSYFIKVEIKLDGESGYSALGITKLNAVPFAMHSETVTNVNDADADPINEIQDLQLDGNTLTITDNVDATEINLSAYTGTNTDEQTLNIEGDNLSISNGNTIDVSSLLDDADADPSNEMQSLSIYGDSIQITGGKGVFLPSISAPFEKDGESIYLPNGNLGLGSVSPACRLEVKGNQIDNNADVLFCVINNTGDTVFAVYQSGVRANVGKESAKGVGRRGGFAVGNLSSGKGIGDMLTVSSDSVRIYVNNAQKGVGRRGGFAVGNLSSGKGFEDYINVNERNAFLGYQAGYSHLEGVSNIFVGDKAGYMNENGSNNVFLGNSAGYDELGSNKLYIQNTKEAEPLVYGDFVERLFQINGRVDILGSLFINGIEIDPSGLPSDRELKKEIQPIAKGTDLFMQLKPVSFSFKTDKYPDKGFAQGTQFGFIAQDMELLYPELVGKRSDGFKNVNYIGITPILVEVVQNQQKTINEQEQRIKDLESKMELILQKLEIK